MDAIEADPVLPAHQPKEDPETFVLRGRPRSAVRFKRGVIVAIAGGLCAAIVALAWTALEPRTIHLLADRETSKPFTRPAPEAIAGAPAAYSDVPRLGPPLPGDLGRPILEHERELASSTSSSSPRASVEAETAARLAAERDRRKAEEQAARSSPVRVALSSGPSTVTPAGESARAASSDVDKPGARNADGPAPAQAVGAGRVLAAGTIIPASLLTGLNSDLPGIVIAQVTENVRDSLTGRTVLIPQGARLIGKYDSKIAYGQQRAFLAWQRILLPDGRSVTLGDMPASDSAGYAGLADRVDGHGWQLIKGVVLSSLLGIGSELSFGGENGLVRALRQSVQQNGAQAGEQVVSKSLSVQPTIKVRPGWPVRVLVSQDIVLEPWNG